MSRKVIKNPMRKKKIKYPEISWKESALQHLNITRHERRTEEEKTIAKMITEEEFDTEKANDYKYLRKIANSLGWTIGKTTSVIDRIEKKTREAIRQAEIALKAKEIKDNGQLSGSNEKETADNAENTASI